MACRSCRKPPWEFSVEADVHAVVLIAAAASAILERNRLAAVNWCYVGLPLGTYRYRSYLRVLRQIDLAISTKPPSAQRIAIVGFDNSGRTDKLTPAFHGTINTASGGRGRIIFLFRNRFQFRHNGESGEKVKLNNFGFSRATKLYAVN
jgi:hypothetical protein